MHHFLEDSKTKMETFADDYVFNTDQSGFQLECIPVALSSGAVQNALRHSLRIRRNDELVHIMPQLQNPASFCRQCSLFTKSRKPVPLVLSLLGQWSWLQILYDIYEIWQNRQESIASLS